MLTLALALLAATPVESALERLSKFKGTWSCTEKTSPDRPFYEVRIESALPHWLLFRFKAIHKMHHVPNGGFVWLVGTEWTDSVLRLFDSGGWTGTFFGESSGIVEDGITWQGHASYKDHVSVPSKRRVVFKDRGATGFGFAITRARGPDHPDEWAPWTEFDCVRMGAP